jgi:beta-lactam-binding protein with PASTA domain
VTVPSLVDGTDVTRAYAILHRLGLRVAFTQPANIWSLGPGNVSLSPAAGTVVSRGSTIEITPRLGPLGSSTVDKADPHYRVPDLIGCTLSQALDWADRTDLYWSVPSLPSPRDNTVAHLFDAYRVVAQKPNTHATLGQGVTDGAGYRPTPLIFTVRAVSR